MYSWGLSRLSGWGWIRHFRGTLNWGKEMSFGRDTSKRQTEPCKRQKLLTGLMIYDLRPDMRTVRYQGKDIEMTLAEFEKLEKVEKEGMVWVDLSGRL